MVRVFILTLALAAYLTSFSQTWEWAHEANGNETDNVTAMASDASGNIYVAGYFNSTTLTFGNTILTISGSTRNLFIAKYSPTGTVLWTRQTTGGGDSQISGIAVSSSYIYVTGSFKAPDITFGNYTLNSPTLWDEIFIVKYDSIGNVIWARKATGNKSDYSNTIAADASGSVYIAGSFLSDTLTFGTTQLLLNSQGMASWYFAKYDANGNEVWANKIAGLPSCLTISKAGNIFMTGSYGGNVIIAGIPFSCPTSSSALFTLKLNSGGIGIWGKSVYNNSLGMYPTGIATDAAENVYMTGQFYNSSFSFANKTFPHVGADDIFVLKYDAVGNEAWANTASSPTSEYSSSIAVDADDNVFITGSFLMNGLTFGGYSINNAGAFDIFVAKYNSAGNVLWAFGNGGSNSEIARKVCISNSSAVIAGVFNGITTPFGPITLTNAQSGKDEIFVAKLGSTVEVEEDLTVKNISIYPNPSAGQFSVTSLARITSLKIKDCVGKVIWTTTEINSNQAFVNLKEVAKGVYFMHLQSETGNLTKKILVVK